MPHWKFLVECRALVYNRRKWGDQLAFRALIEKSSLASFHATRTEVHVWVVPIMGDDLQNRMLLAPLSDDEKAKAGRFVFGKDQRRFVTAHGALRLILAEYTGVDPSELSFAQGENGKPYLRPAPGGGDVFFNLSHSGDYTLIAVTKCLRVGVDIEGIRSSIEYLEMSRKFFSPSECAWLDRQPMSEQVAAFFRLWVVKEAFLKATGVGLSDSLSEIAVTFTSNGNASVRHPGNNTPGTRWLAEEMNLVPGYASALVVEEGAQILKTWNLTEGGSGTLQSSESGLRVFAS
jgi:4'-phosphopantetheinyl transferase